MGEHEADAEILEERLDEFGEEVGNTTNGSNLTENVTKHVKHTHKSHKPNNTCNEEDVKILEKMGAGHSHHSVGSKMSYCFHHSIKWLRWKKQKNNNCIKKLGMSKKRNKCFEEDSKLGFDKCKDYCMTGKWCSKLCLKCTKKNTPKLEKCAGIKVPQMSKAKYCR